MAVEVEIDVELLKREIKKTYASVSEEPEKDFIFPTGRAWAEDLDYPDELANVPEAAVESFAGVANPWTMGRLAEGERVLDLGSGAGTDSLIAAQMVGDEGSVTGVDMTTEMLGKARAAAAEMGATNVEFVESEAEQLPFPDGSFDVVISNGVIDLIPDKHAVFAELYRVLTPGGRIQIPDVTIQNPVSAEGPAQHRPLDRLNCRGAAGSSVRQAPGTTRIRADRDGPARRHLSPLQIRRHAAQGAEVRRSRHHPQGVQARQVSSRS
jgi:SAM-dependent methyltransferase